MRTWQSVNINLLQYCAKERLLKPFRLFLLIKAHYQYSTFLNYSPENLAKRFKIPKSKTVHRYINQLIAAGFCEIHAGHLICRKQKKIARDLGIERSIAKQIEIKPWHNLEQIELRLYDLLLKSNTAQQDFQIAVHHGIKHANSLLTKPTLKKTRKIRERLLLWKGMEPDDDTARRFCSCRQAARLFGTSHTYANGILNQLVSAKFLKSKFVIETFRAKVALKEFLSLKSGLNEFLPGYFYWQDGEIKRHRGRELEFLYK